MANYDDTATVSGTVVSIENGADEVGAKSCVVTVRPTLSGVSSVTETQTGRNLASGGVYEYNPRNMIIAPVYLKTGTYTVSFNRGVNVQYIYIRKGDTVSLVGDAYATKSNSTFFTFTADEDAYYYAQLYRTNTSDTWEDYPVTKPQIEIGSTAHTYEPYTTPTTYTANLGCTIYGGQVDIVNGTGTEEYANTSLTDKNYYYSSSLKRFDCALYGVISSGYMDDFIPPQGYTINHALIVDGANAPDYTMCIFGGKLYIKNLSCSNVSDLVSDMNGKYITYSLATPTDFTFDGQEVPTRLGYNAFWSDEGDTELTYYKSGYGFTSVTVHKETPEGEPVEETRKLHRIIYEGQVDVISGTGLIYRGESGTQYDPPEQISFTPIEIATDEGENTLYADQGDSAITYRKAVD